LYHCQGTTISNNINGTEAVLKAAAKNLEFEKAALLRDRIIELRRESP
jgi:protein-arginine kinase activator protein McsA